MDFSVLTCVFLWFDLDAPGRQTLKSSSQFKYPADIPVTVHLLLDDFGKNIALA